MEYIKNKVHELYCKDDVNCARATLICLGKLFGIPLEQQMLHAAIGLHGAGGYRAQCGFEGALLMIGIYYSLAGKREEEIYRFILLFYRCFIFIQHEMNHNECDGKQIKLDK